MGILMKIKFNASRCFSTSRAKVGFIGLGNMGRHMAINLIKNGHQLTVFDISPQAMQELKMKGAETAQTAAAAAQNADIVITMLPSSPHVKDVYEGLSTLKPKTLLIDCSTIDPTVSRAISKAAEARGLSMVDAPVSGGVGGAERGTLTFMVGGTDAAFARAKEQALEHMGKHIVHCGGAGTGQVAKICNNMILGVSMNAVSEAMNLGMRLGADAKTLAAIINTSSGRCWSSDTYNPVPGVMPDVPSSRGYTGGFGSALMLKDLGLALDAGKVAGAALPTASAAMATYQIMQTQGLGGKDFSAVYAFLAGQLPAGK